MFVKIEILLIMCQKRRENGRNVTSSRATNMGWLWTGRIGPAPVQIMLSVRRAVVIVCGLLQGFIIFSLTSRFFVNSHLDDSRAWIPACLLTVALLHRCFPSNLSTTTQGAIVKLRGASSVLCTLFIWSVQNSKTALARSPLRRTVLGYVGKRGCRGISAAGRGYNEVLTLEVRNVVGLRRTKETCKAILVCNGSLHVRCCAVVPGVLACRGVSYVHFVCVCA